jgi:hypothetical protein
MTLRGWSPLRAYLAFIGALLLVQGLISVLVHGSRFGTTESTHGLVTVSLRHAAIHVVWGLLLLALLPLRPSEQALVAAALVFVVFYGTLTVLGIVLDDPFGLPLGVGENAFHGTIASVAVLALALLLLREPARDAPTA